MVVLYDETIRRSSRRIVFCIQKSPQTCKLSKASSLISLFRKTYVWLLNNGDMSSVKGEKNCPNNVVDRVLSFETWIIVSILVIMYIL